MNHEAILNIDVLQDLDFSHWIYAMVLPGEKKHFWKTSVAKQMLMLYCDVRACTYMIDSWRDWNGIYQPMTDNVLVITIQLHNCRADVHLFNQILILFHISYQFEFFILTAIHSTWITYTMEMKCMYNIFYLTIILILLPRHTALKFMFCCGVT